MVLISADLDLGKALEASEKLEAMKLDKAARTFREALDQTLIYYLFP